MAAGAGNFGAWGLLFQGVYNTVEALGSFSVTKHQNATAKAQANIARINAQMMEENYQATMRAGEKSIVTRTMQAGQVKSSQRAALAANGVAIGVGSAAEMQASTDLIKEMDVHQIESNTLSQAWGYRRQASNYMGQSYMVEAAVQNKWAVFGKTLMNGAAQSLTSYALSNGSLFGSNSGQAQNQASDSPTCVGVSKPYSSTPTSYSKWYVDSNGVLTNGKGF